MGIASLLAVVLLSSAVLGQLPDCLDPTLCDGNLGSCTIGLGCLGSVITMCGFGNLTSNGACEFFSDGTPYCQCNEAIGVVNEVIYRLLGSCSCIDQVDPLVCPQGETLIKCTSSILGQPTKTQYVCTGKVDTTLVSGC